MVLQLTSTVVAAADVCSGKPCVAVTRVAVHDVVLMHRRPGHALEVVADKLSPGMAQAHTAMAFRFENRADIDTELDAERDRSAGGASLHPSRVEQKLRSGQGYIGGPESSPTGGNRSY